MKQTNVLLLLALSLATPLLHAQNTPVVVADGFFNALIGIDLDAQGNIWVGEMGTGNDDGAITMIDPAGNKSVFMTGLPSAINTFTGELAGPYRTYQLPGNQVLVMVGEGPHAQAEALLIVDKADFTPGTPLTLADVQETIKIGDFVHAKGFLQSNPYNLCWGPDGHWYIADSGANSILKRDKDTDSLSIVATLQGFPNPLPFGPPVVDPVPTKVLPKPGGGFYVSQLTGFPFLDDAASIYELNAQGQLSVLASGFTLLTDMQIDPTDGNLCVLQFGRFGPVDTTLNFLFGSAQIIKLLPDGSRDTLASGFGPSASFVFDASGNIYATHLFLGQVLKFDRTTAVQERPRAVATLHAWPNPFVENTSIGYALEHSGAVTLDILDLSGRVLRSFAQGEQSAGTYRLDWDGRASDGQPLEPGYYAYRLRIGQQATGGLLGKMR